MNETTIDTPSTGIPTDEALAILAGNYVPALVLALSEHGALCRADLTRHTGAASATLERRLRTLEREGMISKKRGRGRRILLSLTARGRAAAQLLTNPDGICNRNGVPLSARLLRELSSNEAPAPVHFGSSD